MQNITAYLGEPHVTSEQFRSNIESIAGVGSYIADLDEQLEPDLSTNNTLKIRSGVLIHHGHVMRVPTGTYDTVTYINGSQGMKRIDLVVARYEKNSETKKEPTRWVVIQGTPAASNPVAPVYNDGNMQNGDLLDDCPVFELHFDGLNVTKVKKLVEVTKNIDDLRKGYDELYSTLNTLITYYPITQFQNNMNSNGSSYLVKVGKIVIFHLSIQDLLIGTNEILSHTPCIGNSYVFNIFTPMGTANGYLIVDDKGSFTACDVTSKTNSIIDGMYITR